jgi:hypothetical protein
MGITGFYDWIRKNYNDAIITNPNLINNINMIQTQYILFDHIYFDLNYLLHMFYNEKTLEDKIKRLEDTIIYTCKKYIPIKSVNLFADGVAPLAKLLLQRERRLKESRKYETIDVNNTSLNFTPGTKFMLSLSDKLNKLKNKLEKYFNITVNIITRGNGEGEIKIKNMINKNLIEDSESSHLLITNDGDVLLIVTATEKYNNIYILVRDDLISINKIINIHQNKYGYSKNPQLDFSFLNLFNGNDYFSKLKYINPIKLWDAYKYGLFKYPDGLIDKNLNINKNFLIKILQNLIANIDLKILKKTRITHYNKDYINNYLMGLKWCFNMYFDAEYKDNSYMSQDYNPDPLMLIIYLMNNDFNLKMDNTNILNIPECLGCILLLPEKALCLMNNNIYENYINLHPELYEEERCKLCINYNRELSKLQPEYNKNKDDKEIKKQITRLQKDYSSHNKIHCKIDINYIKKLVSRFNLEFLNVE